LPVAAAVWTPGPFRIFTGSPGGRGARRGLCRPGIRTPANYTVEQCLKDWLETLNTQAESTLTGYRIMVRHLIEPIGSVKLVELRVRDVDFALGKLAERMSTRSVRLARMILIQAIPERDGQ
jgi:hypothetical protein